MEDILHGLNAAQRDSVTSSAFVLQVLAPPGSGKTKTLTARVAYLIAHRHLKPWNIITCTFTKKAASEMKERIRNFIGEELSKQIKLGTFHAIAVRYLRQYGQHIGLEKDFGIADASDSKAILKRIIKRGDYTFEPSPALSRISAQKVKRIDSEQLATKAKHVEQQEFARLFAEYEAELKASNLLDYDDLLVRCCDLMTKHPDCVSNVEAVLIDEFQDTNNIQYELMSLFAQKRNNITIVGDPDQSIYSFRYAENANLMRMKQQWPDTLTINLEENYRSSGAILHAAQNIIEQDESRPPKRLQATHSPGQRPVLRKLPSAAGEAAWLVSEIKRMCALSGGVLNPSDFAILLRSAALSRVIEAALGREGVPYRMVGGVKFFDRAEVKLILDYLRVINNPDNSEAVERVINVPPRRIGDPTINNLREEASSKNISLWSLIFNVSQGRQKAATKLGAAAEKGLSMFVNVILCGRRKLENADSAPVSLIDLINLVITKIDLRTYLNHKYENEYETRWSNVEELIALGADFSDPAKIESLMQEESLPLIDDIEQSQASGEDALSLFLANVTLTMSKEEMLAEGNEVVPQVTISTIHSAKGLEWPVVFIPACYEGSIPHSRSDDNDEERRLLYVGMTRAQAMLYLSCPIKNTQREDTTMSSFLTASGVSAFFEEHGPSMDLACVTGLATTLHREPPSEAAFEKAKRTLEQDEDNYWPLNGEEPAAERAKWDYGRADNPLPASGLARASFPMTSSSVSATQPGLPTTATTAPGFVSVKAKYDELVEQSKLNAIDKRAEARKKDIVDVPKGRKRQIEGQGTISGFFAKRQQPSLEVSSKSLGSFKPASHAYQPLQELSNQSFPTKPTPITTHKLRTAPLRPGFTSQPIKTKPEYILLPSSPLQAENDENQGEDPRGNFDTETTAPDINPQPSKTLHTTTMQSLNSSVPKGKRYGVKPSMNGWANRTRK